MKATPEQEPWVRDDEKTRAYDGKTLKIKGRPGIYVMRVSETNAKGERKPGFVQLCAEPYDLNAVLKIGAPNRDKP